MPSFNLLAQTVWACIDNPQGYRQLPGSRLYIVDLHRPSGAKKDAAQDYSFFSLTDWLLMGDCSTNVISYHHHTKRAAR